MKKLSATQMAAKLNVSYTTIGNWYKYYNDPKIPKPKDMPILPHYEQTSPRGPRYWEQEDVVRLKKFQAWIPKGRNGVMGQVSSSFWGNRTYKHNTLKTEE